MVFLGYLRHGGGGRAGTETMVLESSNESCGWGPGRRCTEQGTRGISPSFLILLLPD